MDLLKHILQAENRIRTSIKHTPLERSLPLSCQTGSEVYLKMEICSTPVRSRSVAR